MPITALPIANGYYKAESLPVSAQECLNCYVDQPSAPALAQAVLYGTPGITPVVSSGNDAEDANRGSRVMKGIPYFVQGGTLYEMDDEGALTSRGTIEGTGRVALSDNGTQLLILVPGGKGYTYTASTTTLAEITDTDFRASGDPQMVWFVDGYFVFTTDESKFIISSLNDGTSYNALDFGSAESSPDGVVAPVVYKNQLFIIGESTMEAFTNIGGADFPFLRSGLFIDKGAVAPFSVVVSSDTFFWIGGGKNESAAVWMMAGNAPQKVSTQPIDSILQRMTLAELQAISAWSYAQAGHYFVGFNLPDTTVVYDTISGIWHERRSRYLDTESNITEVRYRVNSVVTAHGKLYAADALDGRIGELDLDVYTEYGNQILRRAATQPFQNNMQPFFVPYLELTVESGVGNAADPDPKIRMDRSKDGGKTFLYERERPMGKIGEYNRRAVWRRLGRVSRFDVYRFTTTAPVKVVMIQLTADIRGAA